MSNIQVIQWDDNTVQVIRPSGKCNYKVGNSGDTIISGPSVSGNECTIIIEERSGRRLKKVYNISSFGIIRSTVM